MNIEFILGAIAGGDIGVGSDVALQHDNKNPFVIN